MGRDAAASAPTDAALPRRFEFVHDPALRPVVEQAYAESRRALEQGQCGSALLTSCGTIEAIVTDALEHNGFGAVAAGETAAGTIAAWSFETRLAAAERRDSFAAAAPGCRPSRGRIGISPPPTASRCRTWSCPSAGE
jgi:hypothetical protein